MEGIRDCYMFEDVGKKTVALVWDTNYKRKVVVYEDNELVHTCNNSFEGRHSLWVEGSKVYFPNPKFELIEFDTETFQEKALMQGVWLWLAWETWESRPGTQQQQRDFLTVSKTGVLRTRENTQDLKAVFPRMEECTWRAMISVDCFAVLAGDSQFYLSDGKRLPRSRNFFLLVFPETLEVVNQTRLLSVESGQEKGTSVVSLCRLRIRLLLAML